MITRKHILRQYFCPMAAPLKETICYFEMLLSGDKDQGATISPEIGGHSLASLVFVEAPGGALSSTIMQSRLILHNDIDGLITKSHIY